MSLWPATKLFQRQCRVSKCGWKAVPELVHMPWLKSHRQYDTDHPQGQYWAGRTPSPNNGPPNMAAANFVVITNGEGCALNGTAVAAVLINQ